MTHRFSLPCSALLIALLTVPGCDQAPAPSPETRTGTPNSDPGDQPKADERPSPEIPVTLVPGSAEGATAKDGNPPVEVAEPAAGDPAVASPSAPDSADPKAFHAADGDAPARPRDGSKPGPGDGTVTAFTDCKNTETFADGRCHASFDAACEALSCNGECIQMRSMPPQARCSAAKTTPKKPKTPSKGRKVGSFGDCARTETFADGRCYASMDTACSALSCSGKCVQLKSMPPQAVCR